MLLPCADSPPFCVACASNCMLSHCAIIDCSFRTNVYALQDLATEWTDKIRSVFGSFHMYGCIRQVCRDLCLCLVTSAIIQTLRSACVCAFPLITSTSCGMCSVSNEQCVWSSQNLNSSVYQRIRGVVQRYPVSCCVIH